MPKPLTQAQLRADILEAAKKIAEDEVQELRTESNERHKANTEKLDRIEARTISAAEDSAATKVKVDAIYGNGSGKKGAIERIEESLDGVKRTQWIGYGILLTVAAIIGWAVIWFHK